MTTPRSWLRAVALVGAVVGGLLVVDGRARGRARGRRLKPTNYQTVLHAVTPKVPGLTLTIVDLGTQVELTNTGRTEVLVLGYDGEPYLRVGPRGVFENIRSPATYLNRSTTITGRAAGEPMPRRRPRWRQISSGTTARWHDHRAHFMGTDDPPSSRATRAPAGWSTTSRSRCAPATARSSRRADRLGAPAVAVAVDHRRGRASRRRWSWPARTRWWAAVFVGRARDPPVTETMHVIGLWGATTASARHEAAESLYSLAGIVLGLLGLGWMRRKGVESAVPLVLVATIFLFVAGGLADVTSLGNSQVPSSFSRVRTRAPPGEHHPRARRRPRARRAAFRLGPRLLPARAPVTS